MYIHVAFIRIQVFIYVWNIKVCATLIFTDFDPTVSYWSHLYIHVPVFMFELKDSVGMAGKNATLNRYTCPILCFQKVKGTMELSFWRL